MVATQTVGTAPLDYLDRFVKWLLWISMAIAILLVGVAVFAGISLGYSDLNRLGYQSCGACHVSPGGAGVTTAYGRSAGEEQYTFAREGDGRFASLVTLPSWLSAAANTRFVNVNAPGYHKKFLMQQEAEVAVTLDKLTIDVAVGRYGPALTREWRRHYLQYQPSDHLTLRVGRFAPSFGLYHADHTASVRQDLGRLQAAESYAVEGVLTGRIGSVSVASTLGASDSIHLTGSDGYKMDANTSGAIVTTQINISPTLDWGVDYWFRSDSERDYLTAGPHVRWAPARWLYATGEVYRVLTSTEPRQRDVGYASLGVVPLEGLHVTTTYEWSDGSRYGVELRWLPVPHVELQAQARWRDGVLSHTYLAHYSL